MAQLISQPHHLEPGAYDVILVSDFEGPQRMLFKRTVNDQCFLIIRSILAFFSFIITHVSLVISTLALVKKDVSHPRD